MKLSLSNYSPVKNNRNKQIKAQTQPKKVLTQKDKDAQMKKKLAPKSNQIFHYTRWITPKRETSWRGPSPRHCARATQLLSKKCRSGGEPLATLCPI